MFLLRICGFLNQETLFYDVRKKKEFQKLSKYTKNFQAHAAVLKTYNQLKIE